MKKISIISFTQTGKELAEQIHEKTGGIIDIFDNKTKINLYLQEKFNVSNVIIFVCSVDIAIRLIRNLIKAKDDNPEIIVVDELGKYVIPILSRNFCDDSNLSNEIAEAIGAELVMTEAKADEQQFAVDIWAIETGCQIVDTSKIEDILSAIARKEKIGFLSVFPVQGKLPKNFSLDENKLGIGISLSGVLNPFDMTLNAVPRIVTIGVDCRKDVSIKNLEQHILQMLSESHISILAVEKIASIDLKENIVCINAFSKKYEIPFVTYKADLLENDFESSELKFKPAGADGICEKCAVLGSNNGKLILSKTSQPGISIAMAKRDWKCKF